MTMPPDFTITNLTLLENGDAIQNATIAVRDGQFTHAGHGAAAGGDVLHVDGSGWRAAPGYIDVQLNGAYGHDFTQDPSTIAKVAARLPESGVTAFLPTFITSPLDHYASCLQAVSEARDAAGEGARVLGAHVEGPFLNPQRPGAHNPQLIRPPSPQALACLEPLGAVTILTLAPEEPGALQVVRSLRERGVVVSMGHSAATVDQAAAAVEAGVSAATHLFNAMAPLHHRRPGLVGFILSDARVRFGLIADGVHVHPRLIALAYRARGAKGITLVTDAMAAMGMPTGSYALGDRRVAVDESSARLEDGTLAGSVLRLDQAVRNMVTFSGCSAAQAVQMATATPAAMIGVDDRLGHLKAGYAADFVLLDDALAVKATFVGGRLRFAAPASERRLQGIGLGDDATA